VDKPDKEDKLDEAVEADSWGVHSYLVEVCSSLVSLDCTTLNFEAELFLENFQPQSGCVQTDPDFSNWIVTQESAELLQPQMPADLF
jgi:hypothetical protein